MKFRNIICFICFVFLFTNSYSDSIHVNYQNLHYGTITNVAFSPDESKLLTSSNDGSIKLWDVSSGNLLHSISLVGNENASSTLAFSPDGKKYIVCPEYEPAFVVETQSGKKLYSLEQVWKNNSYLGHLSKFIWSPDGNRILGVMDTFINPYIYSLASIYDSYSGKILFTFFDTTQHSINNKYGIHNHSSCIINKIEFSPDGNLFMLSFFEGRFVIFSALNFREIYRKNGEVFKNFNNSGSQFITNTGKIYESNSGNLVKKLKELPLCFRYFKFLPGDTGVILYCDNGTIELQDIKSGDLLKMFEEFNIEGDCQNELFPNDFLSVNEDQIFMTVLEDTVKQWYCIKQLNLKTGKIIHSFHDTCWCFNFQLSPSGKFIFSFFENHIKIWSTESGDLIHRLILTYTGINSINTNLEAISNIYLDEKRLRLFILSKDKRLTKIDFAKGKIKRDRLYQTSKFKDHWAPYGTGYPINDSEYIRLTIHNNQIILSNQRGDEVGNIMFDGKKDWLIYDSKGNYDASRGMSKKLYFVINNNITHSKKLKRQYRKKEFWKGFL